MIFRNRRILKGIAITLSATLLFELAVPLTAHALTTGPTQPEVWGHQPSAATDNVSLVTGAFNYSFPVVSVPEYPMSVGYTAGKGMDDEAGMFGFGFNGFTGAIARNTMGMPDDVNGVRRHVVGENQMNWNVSTSVGMSIADLFGVSLGGDMGFGVGLGASVGLGYDNYKGFFGTMGVSLGASLGLPVGEGVRDLMKYTGTSPVGSLGLGVDTRRGAYGFGGASFASFEAMAAKPRFGELFTYVGHAGSVGITQFSSQASSNASSFSPLATVSAPLRTFNVSVTVPLPTTPPLSVTASYGSFNYGNIDDVKKGYGFLYLQNYNLRDRTHQPDMGLEGEYNYAAEHRTNPSFMQRDYFMINAGGIGGSMQLVQDEYALVSRNYQRTVMRDFGIIAFKTERKEVQPWASVDEAHINKKIDVLKLIKKPAEEAADQFDFDNLLFTQKELVSLTSDERKPNEKPKFKLRGDLAGEMNLASADYKDNSYNGYDLIHIPGTSGGNLHFLGVEKEMPMYYPAIPTSVKDKYNKAKGTLKRSTNVEYTRVGDLLSAYSGIIPSPGTFDFNQSFYTHFDLTPTGISQPAKSAYKLNDYRANFSVLDHLDQLATAHGAYVNDLIGNIRVENPNGLTYYFGLPAFAKASKRLMLQGKGQNAPASKGTSDYVSFFNNLGDERNRGKVSEEEDYLYPYAWLLTGIVGSDYIDFDNVPGPSDGDLGFWVKFKYTRTARNYRWRAPFEGMEHMPVSLHLVQDDMYLVNTGEKEIYVISEIESSAFVAQYQYRKRFDGVEAAHEWNGHAVNQWTGEATSTSAVSPGSLLGPDFQFAVTQVDLYKKHDKGDNSALRTIGSDWGAPIKSTVFEYDYSVCKGVPNNLNRTLSPGSKVTVGDVPYHQDYDDPGVSPTTPIEEGKLTLRSVRQIAYNPDGSQVPLPSTDFVYGFDNHPEEEYNPDYDRHQKDIWGNYSKKSRAPGVGKPTVNYYHGYTELDKPQADLNAQAFNIQQVKLPSGGQIDVMYEARDYGYVQDKTPYVMRHIRSVENFGLSVTGKKRAGVTMDVTDLVAEGKDLTDVLKPNEIVYAEVSYYQRANTPREDELYVSNGKSVVREFGSVLSIGGRYYQAAVVEDLDDPDNVVPYITPCKKYLYGESMYMAIIRENILSGALTCDFDPYIEKYKNLEADSPVDAAIKFPNYVASFFLPNSVYESKFTNCFGDPCSELYEHLSFFRTSASKGKYTGCRVKSISFSDNFQYATNAAGGVSSHSNKYLTRYFYDEQSDGTGVSAGVATIEPGGGEAAVINIYDKRGSGFYPSPSILQGKTSVSTEYAAPSASAAPGDLTSREKGVTIYEFHTPKDATWGIADKFSQSPLKNAPGNPSGHFFLFGIFSTMLIKIKVLGATIKMEVPFWLPVTINWSRKDEYNLRSYSYTDYSDIYGTLKSMRQVNEAGQEIGRSDYTYFAPGEGVPVYDESFGASRLGRPGRVDQVWSESHMTDETKTSYVPLIMFFNANTRRNFNYTNVKTTYVPPILKEVRNSLNGLATSTRYTGFDAWTGQPVQMETDDSYGNTKIVRSVPAYWNYEEMGPSDRNPDHLNMLTAGTGTYRYLNMADDAHLLDAAVQTFTKDRYDFVDYMRPNRVPSTPSTWRYAYDMVPGSVLKDNYLLKTDPRINDAHIKSHNWSYRPSESYVYEVNRKSDDTYDSFTPFTYASVTPSDPKWKSTMRMEKWHISGEAVQSKDILDKYASAHLGYNSEQKTQSTSNAQYLEALHENAENTYLTTAGLLMLQDDLVQVGDATVIDAGCLRAFVTETTNFATFAAPGTPAKVLKLCEPTPVLYDVPVAKLDVVYAHNPDVNRSLFVYADSDGDYTIVSNKGESFTGFITMKEPGCTKLILDPSIFSSITLDGSFDSHGFDVGLINEVLKTCPFITSNYELPDNNCPSEVHTGRYAFLLSGGKQGTYMSLKAANVAPGTWGRAVKGTAWVSSSSPSGTQMVVEVRNAGAVVLTRTAAFPAPYINADEWKQLRMDLTASEVASGDEVRMYMRNTTLGGEAIYDDMRLSPYQSDMSTAVYDHRFARTMSTLDAQGFASWITYDARDRVIQTEAEVENLGRTVISRNAYNDQKQ
jgi:hypothetical protein